MAERPMNRRERRARDKAFRCLEAATFVPAGVRAKLPAKLLQDMAAHKGRTLDSRTAKGKL